MAKKLDLLDSSAIDECEVDLTYKNGFVFGLLLRIIIGIFGGVGIAAVVYGEAGYFIGPPVLLLVSFGLTYQHGTDISIENRYVRSYTRVWGVKRGKWKSTVSLPDLAILKMGTTIGIQYEKNTGNKSQSTGFFDVYLLSKNHRIRLFIASFKGIQKAQKEGEYLADLLDKNFTVFQPKISKQTLARRYERHY